MAADVKLKPRGEYVDVATAETLPHLGKMAIHSTLAYLQLPTTRYFLLGGANLVLRGIRQRTPDIDMLVSEEVFQSLAKRPGVEIHEPPQPAIQRGAQNTTVWLRTDETPMPVSATTSLGDGYYPMSFDTHHNRVDMVEGVPCIELDEIVAAKEALQRPKDISDLWAIALHRGQFDIYVPPAPTLPSPWPLS